MKCEHCNKDGHTIKAMTRYPYDGKSEDPNRDLMLCDEHADAYEEHWQEMWEEYYSAVM